MPRFQMDSVKETAAQILREVEAENRIKTAETQILRNYAQPRVNTDLGQELVKIAAQCRQFNDDPEVSYDDLRNFVAQVDARRTS